MENICIDHPVASSNEDLLNRSVFAKKMAEMIMKVDTSLSSVTLGLYGAWGSGKTSLGNMILEGLLHDEQFMVLRFNPWLCTDERQLTAEFFKQLSGVFKKNKGCFDQISDLIAEYGFLFEFASLIPTVGPMLSSVGKGFSQKLKEQNKEKQRDLQSIKDAISECLKKERVKIVVFIDDIDRLSDNEISAVFQLVKSQANFPNVIYLLSFDYQVVVKALDRIQVGNGERYLEKIIQFPMAVPKISLDRVHKLLEQKIAFVLNDVINKDELDDVRTMMSYGVKQYVKNIRDVNLFSNVLYFKYMFLKEEIYIADLLGITCIEVFEPGVYSIVKDGGNFLCGLEGILKRNDGEKIKIAVERIKEVAKQYYLVNVILSNLFPLFSLKEPLADVSCSVERRGNFLNKRKITSDQCFDRYFSLALEVDDITTEDISNFLLKYSDEEMYNRINVALSNGYLNRYLTEVISFVQSGFNSNRDRDNLLANFICNHWHLLLSGFDEISRFDLSLDYRLFDCVDKILRKESEEDRREFFMNIFKDNLNISMLSYFLYRIECQHGRMAYKYPDSDPVVAKDVLLELEGLFIDNFKKLSSLEFFEGCSVDKHSLYVLENLIKEDEIHRIFTSSYFLKIIYAISCIRISYQTSIGNKSKRFVLDGIRLEKIILISEIPSLLKTEDVVGFIDSLKRDQKISLIALYMFSEKESAGTSNDDLLYSDAEEKLEKGFFQTIREG